MSTFGGWLRQRRKERGITLEELADRISCSRITLVKIESGDRRPSPQIAQLLAEQFDVPADEQEAFVIFARTDSISPDADLLTLDDEVVARAPWRATRRLRTNIPSMLTSLIGREQDEGEVRDLLLQAKVRLLTLTGPPGIGKTRLALQMARSLAGQGQFEDGIYFVELATISDPGLVLPAVARTLDLKETTNQTIEESLLLYTERRRLLLVLDNFEQVLDAAPLVVKLLESSPWSKALVTSREPLHVRGERRYPVPPLHLPDPQHLPPPGTLEEYSAIELFVERAQAVAPDFALVEANCEDVAAVCLGLEGLPLAIELAAARVDYLSPGQIRNALQSRLKLLTGGARDLPTRHRTLNAAIQWSYDLLNEGEQKVFRRLAVFVGGRTAEASEAVCNAPGDLGIEISDGLESLVDKSLLRNEGLAESRFVMLEMVREYALERLDEARESGAIREAHANYFLRLVEEAEPQLRGPQQIDWLNRLEADHDNIRAALRWALESHCAEVGLRLVGALRLFWTQHSHVTEGLQWGKAVLEMPGAQARNATRAKALWSAGSLAWQQSDPEARPLLEESVEIWHEVGDKRGLAYSVQMLGMVMLQVGEPEVGRSLLVESIALFRETGEKLGLILSLPALWINLIAQGDPGAHSSVERSEAQRALLDESTQLARELGDKWGVALSLRNKAWHSIRQGDHVAARPLLKESLQLQLEIGTKLEVAPILADLAQLAEIDGNLEEAMGLYDRSLKIYKDSADRRGVASSMISTGGVLLLMGDVEGAREQLVEALDIVMELGSSTRHSVAALEAVGRLMAALGDSARAAVLLAAAQAAYRPHAFSRPPAARPEYNGYLESARAGLEEATWQQAWLRGEAMSIDEALQFASESLYGVNAPFGR